MLLLTHDEVDGIDVFEVILSLVCSEAVVLTIIILTQDQFLDCIFGNLERTVLLTSIVVLILAGRRQEVPFIHVLFAINIIL